MSKTAGTLCPPFRELTGEEEDKMIDLINESNADIVWVGLGLLKQERWIKKYKDRIDAISFSGVGAAFDFHSGNVRWAPIWVRKIGLEWFYRLICEPKRWRRYIDIPRFLFAVTKQRLRKVNC